MKISPETINILQKYTNINQSILIQEGNVLRTIDYEKTITSSANIVETFPKSFAIYDLPNFLQVIKMFDGASIDFGDEDTNFCVISYASDDNAVRFGYASPDAVEHVKKDLVMPQTEINFILSKDNLNRLSKAATTMELPHILLTPGSKENEITITAMSVDNPASNTFTINVKADLSISDFSVIIDFSKIANLLEAEYNVGISTKEISHFYNENIQYWVALNAQSSFSE